MVDNRDKTVFIINRRAANGTVGRQWPRLARLALRLVNDPEFWYTEAPGAASGLAAKAVKDGFGTVVAVGGDGTLNEVVNGLMAVAAGRYLRPRLGYLPLGTGCDMARTLGISRNPAEALAGLTTGRESCLDLGYAVFEDMSGHRASRYFHNVLGIGLGGEVAGRTNRTTKFFGGFASFLWATMATLPGYKKKSVSLRIDNRRKWSGMSWQIVLANGQFQGGGMRIAPGAKVDDGLFEITVIGDLSLPEIFVNLANLYNGKILKVNKIECYQGQKIEVRSADRVLLELDGEQVGRLPLTVEIRPAALRFVGASDSAK